MKKIIYSVLLLACVVTFSACQAFLEDYNFSPVGETSSSPSY